MNLMKMGRGTSATPQMASHKMTLITGGARSGKSRFAETRAAEIAGRRGGEVVYLATMQPLDEEMKLRISQHKERRPASWRTIEEPLHLEAQIEKLAQTDVSVVILDCITLWLSNLFLRPNDCGEEAWKSPDFQDELFTRVTKLADLFKQVSFSSLIVTNEVGDSIVPVSELGRKYRDLAGQANQILAAAADEVFLTVCGIPVNLSQMASAGRDRR